MLLEASSTHCERDVVCTESSVLRGIFGTKRRELIGVWRKLHNEGQGYVENYIMSFIICACHQVLSLLLSQGERLMHTKVYLENVKRRISWEIEA